MLATRITRCTVYTCHYCIEILTIHDMILTQQILWSTSVNTEHHPKNRSKITFNRSSSIRSMVFFSLYVSPCKLVFLLLLLLLSTCKCFFVQRLPTSLIRLPCDEHNKMMSHRWSELKIKKEFWKKINLFCWIFIICARGKSCKIYYYEIVHTHVWDDCRRRGHQEWTFSECLQKKNIIQCRTYKIHKIREPHKFVQSHTYTRKVSQE